MATHFYSDGTFEPKPFATYEEAAARQKAVDSANRSSAAFVRSMGGTPSTAKTEIVKVPGGYKVKETTGK